MNNQLKIRTECALFFEENPYTLETAEGVARRIGRKPEHIRAGLEQLARMLILEELGTNGQTLYRYLKPDTTIIGPV